MLGEEQCHLTLARDVVTLVMQDRYPVCFIAAGCKEESAGLARTDL